jgi:uncharacterized membrane protein YdbT with pleckstrin-like domain
MTDDPTEQGQRTAKRDAVVFEEHPHWVVLVKPAGAAVIACVVSIAGVVVLPSVPLWLGMVMLVVVVTTVLRLVWCYLDRKATIVALTPVQLRWSEGLAVRKGQDFQLARLNDTSLEQGVIGRIFGFGTLIVETGGEQSEKVFPCYPHPEQMQDKINEAINALGRAARD